MGKRSENLPVEAIISNTALSLQQQVILVRDWYKKYFTQVFRTFPRKTVGKKISPADQNMSMALNLLPAGARKLPPSERPLLFIPLEILLRAIADAWEDASSPALSALHHWGEVKEFYVKKYKDGLEPMSPKSARAEIARVNRHLEKTKEDLNRLSIQLLNANQDDIKQTLAAIALAAQTAADQARLATDGTTRIEENTRDIPSVKAGVDELHEILKGSPQKPRPMSAKARAGILKLYDDFMDGKLDNLIPDRMGRHTQQGFLDWCGEMKAYKTADGTIVTVNECLPDGLQQLHSLIHTRDQAKHASK